MKRFFLGGFLDLPKAMWVLFVIQILLRGGDFVFPFLTLFLTRKLGLNGAQAGLWVMANVVSGLLGTMVAGKASDHLGRRNAIDALAPHPHEVGPAARHDVGPEAIGPEQRQHLLAVGSRRHFPRRRRRPAPGREISFSCHSAPTLPPFPSARKHFLITGLTDRIALARWVQRPSLRSSRSRAAWNCWRSGADGR